MSDILASNSSTKIPTDMKIERIVYLSIFDNSSLSWHQVFNIFYFEINSLNFRLRQRCIHRELITRQESLEENWGRRGNEISTLLTHLGAPLLPLLCSYHILTPCDLHVLLNRCNHNIESILHVELVLRYNKPILSHRVAFIIDSLRLALVLYFSLSFKAEEPPEVKKADSSSPLPRHISARGAQFHIDSLQSRCSRTILSQKVAFIINTVYVQP